MNTTRAYGRGVKGAVWSIASTLLSRGAGIIFTPIFTRMLTPSEFGVYSLYTGLMGIFTVICTLEISGNAIYKGFAKFDGERTADFRTAAAGAQTVMTLLSLAFYMLFRRQINSASGLSGYLPAVLILQIFFNAVTGIYLAGLRYGGEYKTVALINAVQGLVAPPLALILIRSGIRATGRIYAHLAVGGAVALILLIKILKDSKRVVSLSVWRYLFALLLPMLPHYLGSSLLAQSDKIIVAKRVGEAAVGKYSAAFSVGHLTSLITGGASLALTPFMMRKFKSGRAEDAERAAKLSVRLAAALTLGFMTVLPEAFGFFASAEYAEALPVAYLISLSVLFSFSTSLINTALLYYGKASVITKNTLITVILTLPLSFLLADRIGYFGCAAASLLSYIILIALSYKSLSKITQKSLVNANSYLQIFLVALIGAVSIFVARPAPLARIVLFLAISAILLLEAKQGLKRI